MYTRHERQAKVSWAFKSIFLFSLGVLAFVWWWLPGPAPVVLVVVAALSAVASIALDIARGSNVMLWTLLMLVAGAAVLAGGLWMYQSLALSPLRPLFNFSVPTPTHSL
jgi:hypothetical protein